MPATVIRLDNRPVVVTTFFEPVHPDAVEDAFQRAMDLSARMGGSVFWVVDLRGSDDSFVEVADLWQELCSALPGQQMAFVGLAAMSEYFAEVGLPFFREVNEAIALLHINRAAGRIGA